MPTHAVVAGARTPAELLDHSPVQSCSDAAHILKLYRRNGEPNRRAVHSLVRSGAIAVVDSSQPIHRWTISSVELRRYIADGPRAAS